MVSVSQHSPEKSLHEIQESDHEQTEKEKESTEKKLRIFTLLQNRSIRTFFKDGKRKIDFILTYDAEEEEPSEKAKANEARVIERLWRRKFLENLKKIGMQIEREMVVTSKKRVVFVKLHAPFEVLCLYGELLRVKLPFAFSENSTRNWTELLLGKLKLPNIMVQDVPLMPPQQFSSEFHKSKMGRFLHFDDPEVIFLPRNRHLIVNSILESMTFGKQSRQEMGIGRLIKEKIFTSAFPLHDGPYMLEQQADPSSYNQRQILKKYWASARCWHKYQPLDHIRDYFGEKIAIYFAWLGFYTSWLHLPAIVGLAVCIYGVVSMRNHIPTNEVCDSGEDFKMCPLCDGCPFWYLSDSCIFFCIVGVFDNSLTVAYSVFLSLWSVLFLEFWKRTNAELSYRWEVYDFERDEPPRPEFAAHCKEMEINPITGEPEPYFPKHKRLTRMATSVSVLLLMVTVVIIAIIGVTIYRSIMMAVIGRYPAVKTFSVTIASVSATCLHLFIIIVLGQFYQWLAYQFTSWEMHRTKTEFEDNYIFKVFLFHFFNYYSSIFYSAFFKGRFIGFPGNYNTVFGFRMEECLEGGCLYEVVQQIVVFMIVKQIATNVQELVLPKVQRYLHRKNMGQGIGNTVNQHPWEVEFELHEDKYGLFEEFLELIIQYGFLTFFVATFPLAPFFALVNNYIEIRLDAWKYVHEWRRPVGEKAQDIGTWFLILEILSQMAVITNACLIAFTTTFLPKLLYSWKNDGSLVGYTNFTLAWASNGTYSEPCRYRDFRDEEGTYTDFHWELLVLRLGFVLIFEHIVFGISTFVGFIVPDVPADVQVNLEREKFLSREIMADVHIADLLQKKNEGELDVHSERDVVENIELDDYADISHEHLESFA